MSCDEYNADTPQQGDIPGNWRYVVAISGGVSALQIALGGRVYTPESKQSAKPAASSENVEAGSLSPVEEQVEGQRSSDPAVTKLIVHPLPSSSFVTPT